LKWGSLDRQWRSAVETAEFDSDCPSNFLLSANAWLRQLPHRASGAVSNQEGKERSLFRYTRMRLKLKYVLPIVQSLLAVALIIWNRAEAQSVYGTPLPFKLLCSINAPVAVLRELLWSHRLYGWWDYILFVAAIGVFWYWVALNIHSWRQTRRVLMFSWEPLRLAGDALAVGTGALWLFIYWREPRSPYMPVSWLSWIDFLMALLSLWSVALIFFFGRDLIHCVLRKNPLSTAPNRV